MILREFGFLVDDNTDEMLMIRQRLFDWRFSRPGLDITVALTMACNLRCSYCYESSVRSSQTILPEVEEALLEYIWSNLGDHQNLTLTWYGGEPLMLPDVMIRLSSRIKEIVDKKNARLSMGIITNGTLITQEIINDFVKAGGGSVQVTLDGPQAVHDKRRPFADGNGSSYQTILRNLSKVDFGPIQVFVRCNLDKHNSDKYDAMLEDLRNSNCKKGLNIYPASVVSWGIGQSCRDLSDWCYSPEEFVPIRREFESNLRKHGFPASRRPFPKTGFCAAEHPRAFTLGPDGAVYKCWDHVGNPDFAVGNLLFGTDWTHWVTDWAYFDPTRDPKCGECTSLPLCMGGCHEKARRLGERSCETWKFELHDTIRQWVIDWAKEVKSSACISRK